MTRRYLILLLKENTDLNIVSDFPDTVHFAKRKRQSFSNWFLCVDIGTAIRTQK